VVNALVHRDYLDAAAEVHLRIRGANVSVLNPGGMVPPLTIEIVMSGGFAPRSRNGTLAEALIRLGGYMEKRGTGIARMKRLCAAAKLPPPVFTEQAGTFSVVFKAQSSLLKRTFASEPRVEIPEDELHRLNLSEAHFEILELVESKGAVRPIEVQKHLNKSRPFVNARLDELLNKLVLIRSSDTKYDPNATFKLHPRFSGKPTPTTSTQAKLL
jgi:predicted HTH transcriptional regulator